MDKSSNELWINADNADDFEMTRQRLFRDDMREIFFKWFRIKPEYKVLDGGCGPSVLTRFIAKGLDSGKITGFDISKSFVDYGNKKIKEEGLSEKAKIVLEDGFSLSFADNAFDVVVNHTYIGVLSDPAAGLKELIRVCKIGGTVSASASSRSFPSFGCDSDCAFKGNDRLKELKKKHEEIYQKIFTPGELKQSDYWHAARYPKLFAECGLKNITIHPYASGFSYSDNSWPEEFKIYHIKTGINREIESLEQNKEGGRFAEHGFSNQDFDELANLYKRKQEYLLSSLKNNEDWEWQAGTHYIVSGTKIL